MLKLRCGTVRDGEQIRPFAKFYLTIKIPFLIVIFLGFVFLAASAPWRLHDGVKKTNIFLRLFTFTVLPLVLWVRHLKCQKPRRLKAKVRSLAIGHWVYFPFLLLLQETHFTFHFSFSTQECKWVLKTMKSGKLDKLLCATSYWLTFYSERVTVYTSTLNEAWIRTSSTTASYMSYSGL